MQQYEANVHELHAINDEIVQRKLVFVCLMEIRLKWMATLKLLKKNLSLINFVERVLN